MKEDIHPDYHDIQVKTTDGEIVVMRSTYGEPGAMLILQIDNKSHPLWTGASRSSIGSRGKGAKFKKKFKGFVF